MLRALEIFPVVLAFCIAVAPGCGQVDVVGDVTAAAQAPAAAVAEEPADAATLPQRAAPMDAPMDAGVSPGEIRQATTPPCSQAARLFSQALCACGQVAALGNLRTEAVGEDASAGSAAGADVRLQGSLRASGFSGPIAGDLWLLSEATHEVSSDSARILGDLYTRGPLALEGALRVQGDVWSGQGVSGSGSLSVAGDLYVDQGVATENVQVDGQTRSEALPAATGCECDGTTERAISTWVAAAQERARAVAHTGATARLALPEGVVWAEAVTAEGDLTLEVTAPTGLFIEGDLTVAGDLRAELAVGAELGIFVAGDLTLGGAFQLAPEAHPAQTRVYVAGDVRLLAEGSGSENRSAAAEGTKPNSTTGAASWQVNLFAPQLELTFSGSSSVSGSLHIGGLTALGGVALRHDPLVTTAVEVCGEP